MHERKITTVVKYHFWCDKKEGNLRIQEFVNKAYEWYAAEMESTEDHARYMYSLVSNPEPPSKKKKADGTQQIEDNKDKHTENLPLR